MQNSQHVCLVSQKRYENNGFIASISVTVTFNKHQKKKEKKKE